MVAPAPGRLKWGPRALLSFFVSVAVPPLLRLQTVWLPTVWGWLTLLVASCATLLALAFMANAWLAPNQPLGTRASGGADGARILIVEGWLDEADLMQAIAAFRRGHYERIVTTGGPIDGWTELQPWRSFAERSADFLKQRGLGAVQIDAVAAPASAQDRTFLSAVMVRDWAQRSGVTLSRVDLFSAGVHARRSHRLFQMAFGPNVEVGVLASRPLNFDPDHWWRSSAAAKAVLGEVVSMAWTSCCFWPPVPGSHEERWAQPAATPR